MTQLLRAEVLKLRTTRLWIVLLGVSVAVVALIVVAILASNPGTDPEARALHDLETVAFEYVPNEEGGPILTGDCRMEVPSESFGGNVNERITSDFEFAVVGEITRTWPAP